jgi:hydroxymethylpyrimidine/phosphomethylpyrimidine kinase
VPRPSQLLTRSSAAAAEPPRVALTVAGFDPSSGAGITADLAVFAAHGLFGTAAITALTVQSTQGVADVQPVDPAFLRHTLNHLVADLPPAGLKIGVLGSEDLIRAVAQFLRTQPTTIPTVLDPVLRSSSGHDLLPPSALDRLHAELLPLVSWITPNGSELAALTNLPVTTADQAREAADALATRHPALHIVATGGDQPEPVDLLRLPTGAFHLFRGELVPTTSTHGTGCAFSAALLANLVLGAPAALAVAQSQAFVTEALRLAPGLGHGRGPLNLLWPLRTPGSL